MSSLRESNVKADYAWARPIIKERMREQLRSSRAARRSEQLSALRTDQTTMPVTEGAAAGVWSSSSPERSSWGAGAGVSRTSPLPTAAGYDHHGGFRGGSASVGIESDGLVYSQGERRSATSTTSPCHRVFSFAVPEMGSSSAETETQPFCYPQHDYHHQPNQSENNTFEGQYHHPYHYSHASDGLGGCYNNNNGNNMDTAVSIHRAYLGLAELGADCADPLVAMLLDEIEREVHAEEDAYFHFHAEVEAMDDPELIFAYHQQQQQQEHQQHHHYFQQ